MPYRTMGEAPVTPPQPEYTEEPFKLVINQTLALNDSFNDLRQAVDPDGDLVITDVYGSSDGPYSILFRNAGLRAMSSAQVKNLNAVGTAQFPVPFGAVKYPAGGQISYAITNLHTGSNAVQLVLSGIRLRKPGR